MTGTQTIQVSEATYNALMEEANALGVTPEEWIRLYLPTNGNTEESGETIGERLERKGLIGIIDSSQPNPDLPPIHTPFGPLLVEKFSKQGLNLP